MTTLSSKKISQLVDGGSPASGDDFVIQRGAGNFKIAWDALVLAAALGVQGTFLDSALNLSDVADVPSSRANLGLGSMGLEATANWLSKAGNLAGLADLPTSRTNLGLGTGDSPTFNGLTLTGVLKAVDGTNAAVAQSFASSPTTGWNFASSQLLGVVNGTLGLRIVNNGASLVNLTFGSTSSANLDTVLTRDGAGILALRNGATPQSFRSYSTFTDAANYERLAFGNYVANVWEIRVENAGTGVARSLRLYAGATLEFGSSGTARWQMQSSGGHFVPIGTTNTIDIGAAANAPRSIYWGTQALAPDGSQTSPAYSFGSATGLGFLASGGSVMFSVSGSGRLSMGSSGGSGFLQFASAGGVFDATLVGEAANVISQRNGASAQTFRVYNTFTDASNNEFLEFSWASNLLTARTSKLGTGSFRSFRLTTGSNNSDLQLGTNNGVSWFIQGSTNQFLAQADNANDIGLIAGNRPRNIYAAGVIRADSTITAKANTVTPAGGVQALVFGTTSALGVYYGSGAPTIAAGQGSLYIRTDGSAVNNRAYVNTDGGTTWTAISTIA